MERRMMGGLLGENAAANLLDLWVLFAAEELDRVGKPDN
jgi:hypothetical protein